MIVPALLVALLQTVPPPSVLVVRSGPKETVVPLVETRVGLALRADRLAPALDVPLRALPNGRHVLALPGADLTLIELVPFAAAGGQTVPLSFAPFVAENGLYIPFQVVSELVPRYATGLLYDPVRGELRAFATVARTRPAEVTPASRESTTRESPRRPASGSARPAGTRPAARRRLVVVDAGHGGVDPGMHGTTRAAKGRPKRTIYEKDVTLSVARALQRELAARGVGVVMTRTTDTLIALSDRGRIANQKRGDLFISIHVNAANPRWKDPSAARGFETYFLAEAKTEDAKRVEQMENEAVRFETGAHAPKDDPLSFIINDMAQNEHLREAAELADVIQRRLGEMHPGPSRGVKQAGFRVLVTAYMPAVLVELGFGTNPDEAAFLADPKRQRELAASIADAAVEYLQAYERRVAPVAP